MVSTCLRARSLLGACSEKTERKRKSEPADLQKKTPPCHVMSCCVTSLHLSSKSHLVSFFALMWLEAEWSSTSKCVGPSIIPLCKYLHKETCISQKQRGSGPWNSLFYRAIYSYDQRQREGSSQQQEGGGGASGWKRKIKERRMKRFAGSG